MNTDDEDTPAEQLESKAITMLTRRDVLLRGLMVTATTAAIAPSLIGDESKRNGARSTVSAFVPDNDYPFFGGTLPEGY